MIDDDNEIEPEQMLMQRLMRQEIEIRDYKAAVEYIQDELFKMSDALCTIIESLPEPEILREICESSNLIEYSDYMDKTINYIDNLKLSIADFYTDQLRSQMDKLKND